MGARLLRSRIRTAFESCLKEIPMNLPTSDTPAGPRYTGTAVALHWVIAGLILCALVMGWIMTELAFSPLKLKMFNWHKWAGMTVLALAVIRLAWRLTHQPPAMVPMPAIQAFTAHAIHIALYVLMFLQPITGWLHSNAAGYPVVYLGIEALTLPNLVTKSHALAETFEEVHELLGWALLVLFALHALAALKHHLVDKDTTLRRMLPW